MEHVFPIRCSILETSPNVNTAHQRDEIEKNRVILVEDPSASEESSLRRRPSVDNSSLLPPNNSTRSGSPDGSSDESNRPESDISGLGYTAPSAYGYLTTSAVRGGVAHGIVTGDRFFFTRCEDEPIHFPGAIQSHGILIGVQMAGKSTLRYICRVVSENAVKITNYSVSDILGLPSLTEVFPPEQRSLFHNKALAIRSRFARTGQSSEPEVFAINFVDPDGVPIPMWCAMHFVGGAHKLLICEFEVDMAPYMGGQMSNLPPSPVNTLDNKSDDATSSFNSKSEPLYLGMETVDVFRGESRCMDVIHLISRIQEQLSSQTKVQQLLDVIVGITQELTGSHRCMVYRFDEEYNGEAYCWASVLSEVVDPRSSTDVFKGLHFPASDIPKQARDLYMKKKVRLLFDRLQRTSRLVSRPSSYLDSPLDLTQSYLRAMSPVHMKYLSNIGVRSAMSISIECGNKLWGLICCLSYGPTGTQVPFPVRELCYWFGMSASTALEKLLHAERLYTRRIADTLQPVLNAQPWLSTSSEGLLRLFNADCGFLVIQGEARTIGKLTSHREAVTLLRYVFFRNFREMTASRHITTDFKDLVFQPGFKRIAGLICIPLSKDPGDFVLLFRSFQETQVHWAGNPHLSKVNGHASLEPRNSFKKWTETVRGTCQPWTEEQLEAAALTRLVYGNFIRVWREKEAALHESRMKRLLIINLSHEVRTPLNAVTNYLEMALEQDLDRKTKSILQMSHSASKSLIFVIDELLQFTAYKDQPPPALVRVTFDLHLAMREALEPLENQALRKGLDFRINQEIDFPRYVLGDQQRLQQAIANVVVNAIQYTDTGGITVTLRLLNSIPSSSTIEISVQDSGRGMTDQDLDNIFQEFEQVAEDNDGEEDPGQDEDYAKPSTPRNNGRHIGLGLAILARYVKNTGGQIRGRSTPGVGTTFTVEVPLENAIEQRRAENMSEDLSDSEVDFTTPRSTFASIDDPRRPSLTKKYSSSPDIAKRHGGDSGSLYKPPGPSRISREASYESTGSQAGRLDLGGRLRIIVADDNSVNCAILMRRLNKAGHDVKLCRDGQQCVEAFQQDRTGYNFILMDINMPIVCGVEATKMIRALESATLNATPLSISPKALSRHSTESFEERMHGWDEETPPTGIRRSNTSDLVERTVRTPLLPPNSISSPGDRLPTRRREHSGSGEQSYFPHIRPRASYRTLNVTSPPLQKSPSPVFVRPLNKPIPIFAVSANLNQHSQESLEAAGFDGWLSKPIDYTRLGIVLRGSLSEEARAAGRYSKRDPKAGGWFR